MKKVLMYILFTVTVLSLNSQNSNLTQLNTAETSTRGFDRSRLTFGGGFGMQFGSYTLINIAPQVGYNFWDNFNAGAGISYSYYKHHFFVRSVKWYQTRHYAGVNVYARYYPIRNIVVSIQPEANHMWLSEEPHRGGDRYSKDKFVPSVTVGAGLAFRSVTTMLKYDIVQNKYSPYGNSIFYSVGFTF